MTRSLIKRAPTADGLGEYQLWLVQVDPQTQTATPKQIDWVWVGLFVVGLMVVTRR